MSVFINDRITMVRLIFPSNLTMTTLIKVSLEKTCFIIAGIFIISTKLWAGPLHDAVEVGSLERIEQLVKQGEDVDEIDERGIWPLLAATTYGDNRSVELLLKLGADPNLADQYNYTPMHEAATLGWHEVVEIFIKAKASINTRDISGFTPLGYAKRSGSQEVIEVLKRYDAHL